jgi:hypothetical protein
MAAWSISECGAPPVRLPRSFGGCTECYFVVLERGARDVAGIEVKAVASVTAADFRGLRKLRDAAGARFAAGVVLYNGETSASFGEGLYAVSIRGLWGDIVANVESDEATIVWGCPFCGDNGVIRGWEGTMWDRSRRSTKP